MYDEENTLYLATRLQRFFASIIDAILIALITMPLTFFIFGSGIIKNISAVEAIVVTTLISMVGVLFFLLINYKYLLNDGQTIGKKVLKIKILNKEGEEATKQELLKRYGLYFGIGFLPILGGILSLVNVLFIFGKEKKCGHDYFAKTIVVEAE